MLFVKDPNVSTSSFLLLLLLLKAIFNEEKRENNHTEVVGGYDDAVLEFQGQDGCSCDDGLLRVCGWGIVLHV